MMKLRERFSRGASDTPERQAENQDIAAEPLEAPVDTARESATSVLASWFGPRSRVPIYIGVTLIAAGFGIAAYTWGKVAGLLHVPLQLPYIASGGAFALSLVVIGSFTIWLAGARRDAALREERLDEIAQVLRSVAETVKGLD